MKSTSRSHLGLGRWAFRSRLGLELLRLVPIPARDAFISRDLLPTNSTDLNPIDYKLWGEIQQRVYQVHNVDELKQRLIDVWHRCEQSVINDALNDEWRTWRKRLCAWIYVKAHFEHGKYDMNFVANFMKNTRVEEFHRSANICQVVSECICSDAVFYSLCTSVIQGQVVKGQAKSEKRCLVVAKLLLCFRKSGSLNLMTRWRCQNFDWKMWNSSLCARAVQIWQKKTHQNDWRATAGDLKLQ